MSFGHSSAVRFDVNQHSGAPGIVWQKGNKVEKRKFGYKSKNLRHEIRQPDDTEVILELERRKEEEKKKFNKDKKDFIQRNRQRYYPKEQMPPPGSTHITPGTVTLTQDQLASLLASLSVIKGENTADNPLKISFDANSNKIEVERYESDGGSGDERDDEDEKDGGVKSPALGIYNLLGDGGISKKESKPKKEERRRKEKVVTRRNKDTSPERNENKNGGDGDSPLNTARSTLEESKKDAGVAHISPRVPLKHMTVGERKRLQWAMERAELEKEYDPWGRPGAGAPPAKEYDPRGRPGAEAPPVKEYDPWGRPGAGAPPAKEYDPWGRPGAGAPPAKEYDPWGRPGAGAPPAKTDNYGEPGKKSSEKGNKDSKQRSQQEDLQNDIEKLRKEIQEAEKKKEKEEQRIITRLLKEAEKEKGGDKSENNEGTEKSRKKDGNKREAKQERRKKNRDNSQQRGAEATDSSDKVNSEKVQIVFITKKKREKEDTDEEDINVIVKSSLVDSDNENEKESKKERKKRKGKIESDKNVDENSQGPEESGGKTENTKEQKQEDTTTTAKTAGTEADTVHLSKKEIERRKWVEELNKQREEQRLKKQLEREMDKAGIHDQWADRFVYQKSQQQTSPRRGQAKSSPREEVSVLSKVTDTGTATFDTPAAMRSSMVIGTGTMNETRFDSKKAEEKKRWLEELDRQREEKQQLMAARKEKERIEDGMWADRYPTDRHKLNQFAQAASPRTNVEIESHRDTHRVRSAPEPEDYVDASLRDSQEQPTTFLRGQGVYVDPVTRKEQEEKRRLHMEYQAQIKAQIEEKERQKKDERGRKAREDMEEEKKFRMERDRVTMLEEVEQRKNKDREALQQKQLAVLKSAMEEAQEKATEEKNLRRIQDLQQRGHDVSHLKAKYQESPEPRMLPVENNTATTPRVKEYNTSVIPGLGQGDTSPLPSEQLFIPSHPPVPATHGGAPSHNPNHHKYTNDQQFMSQAYSKDPYVENRVLTPSRMRNPSKPRDDPNSPRREFGTQTLELKDLQSILSSLPDDIQIEYKMKVEEALKEKQDKKPAPSRKVHSKSAEARTGKAPNKTVPRKEVEKRERVASKERPVKGNEKPLWNQRKTRTIVKNSEKDPFYQQKKEESEARKAKRERQLQYLQELNKERIPNLSPTRARAASPDHAAKPGGHRERGREPNQKKGRQARGESNHRSGSPNILTVTHDINTRNPKAAERSSSPPVPTVKHNTVNRNEDDPYFYTNNVLKNSQTEGRYADLNVATAPVHDGEFVPFTRTTVILDPARADEPMVISRENSRMERARRAYIENHHPARQGRPLNVLQDRERESALRAQQDNNNPILNPHLVTDHPTGRQDKILQQLSSLKQNLMQRRKELENFMSPSQLEA